MKMSLVVASIFLSCAALAQQQSNQTQYPTEIYLGHAPSHNRMTVDDVIRLSQAGMSDDIIIAQIQKKDQRFDLSTNDLVRLKSAGVSNRVIQGMVDPKSLNTSPAAPPATQANATKPPPVSPSAPQPVATTPVAPASPTVQAPATSPTATLAVPIKVATTLPEPSSPSAATAPPVAAANDGKLRVYVSDSPITEVISMIQGGSYGTAHASGYANGGSASYSASAQQGSHVGGITNDQRGGADPRTLEVSGDIGTECHVSNLVVTSNPDAADYILDFRRRGGTRSTWFAFGGLSGLAMSAAVKVDHAGLYKPNGDLIVAAKARTVGGAVKEICPYIR